MSEKLPGTQVIKDKLKEMANSHKWWLGFFGLVHIVILPLLFNTIYQMPYTSTGIYYEYASMVLEGSVPYRDFALEYPPFSLVFFILPLLFTSSMEAFSVAFQIQVFLFNLLGLYMIYRIANHQEKSPREMLAVYTAAVLAIGPIIAQKYDVFPAILVLVSLYFFSTGKHKASWAMLALGTMAKLFPAIIAPVYIAYYLINRQYKRIWSGIGIFAGVSLMAFLPFLIAGPGSLLSLLDYHALRGVQLESVYSGLLLMANKLGLITIELEFSAGSWNVASPLADTLAVISTFVLAASLLLSYWLIYRRIAPGEYCILEMAACCLLACSVMLITNKVLSPQYLIWLLPLLPLLSGRLRYGAWAIFIMAGMLTYYIFPLNYFGLMALEPGAVTILFLRNVLLVVLAVFFAICVYSLRNPENADHDTVKGQH